MITIPNKSGEACPRSLKCGGKPLFLTCSLLEALNKGDVLLLLRVT